MYTSCVEGSIVLQLYCILVLQDRSPKNTVEFNDCTPTVRLSCCSLGATIVLLVWMCDCTPSQLPQKGFCIFLTREHLPTRPPHSTSQMGIFVIFSRTPKSNIPVCLYTHTHNCQILDSNTFRSLLVFFDILIFHIHSKLK